MLPAVLVTIALLIAYLGVNFLVWFKWFYDPHSTWEEPGSDYISFVIGITIGLVAATIIVGVLSTGVYALFFAPPR